MLTQDTRTLPYQTRESNHKPVASRRKAHLRDMLMQELQNLTDKLDAQTGEMADDGFGEGDSADRASNSVGQSNRVAIERLWQSRREEVERALARLEEGTYGLCGNCGREIPQERLMAMPSAALCIDCARRQVPTR